MFKEFARVKQEAGDGRRRWFDDDGMELIVWLDAADQPRGFQLCYQGAGRQEHALTWRAPGGFAHNRVLSGDSRPDKNQTPILVPDGVVPWAQLRREFAARSGALEPALREFITTRLAEGEP
ncbi:MAG TPA: hypothetical protein VF388_03550 [Lacunisphaera sp.]